MSHGIEPAQPLVSPSTATTDNALINAFSRALDRVNKVLLNISMVALVLTAAVLTYSVVSRYFFKVPTDWQDEASVFMLVGVTFFCSAYVQSYRGHIGIEALASLLPPKLNIARLFFVDVVSFLFCAFFAWKSWALFHEAWVDGQTTTSTFAPPLWIPYGMMSSGMTLLALQLLLQALARITNKQNAASS